MPALQIAIANDHPVIVEGLAALLAPFSDQVRVAELDLGRAPSEHVDVVLFDTFAHGEAHVAVFDVLVGHPNVGAVAIYSANVDQHLVDAALTRGVRGYLTKAATGAELVRALERVAAGDTVVLRHGRGPDASPAWPGRDEDLTEREAEVLALIVQGLENTDIAERLFISPNTVKSRIRTLYRKIGADNRVQAAMWGVHHGFDARLPAD